jgi:nicotinamide riboside kinase
MCKIIAFSGSHGVGKTSLVKKFAEHISADLKVFHEINTGLFKIGYALNGRAYDFDEVMFSQKQAFDLGYALIKYYLSKEDDRIILSDRSCIDTMIYTQYFLQKNPQYISKYAPMMEEMMEKNLEISSKIEHILVPPFEDFDDVSERMSVEERDLIWQAVASYFSKNVGSYLKLAGASTDLRYEEVCQFLSSKKDFALFFDVKNQRVKPLLAY